MRPVKACVQCRLGKRKCSQKGNSACEQCIQRNLACSASKTRGEPQLPTSPRAAPQIASSFDEESLHLVDLYFRYMHDKPHSLFHEGTFRASVVDKTVARPVLLSMMGLSARFSEHANIRSRGPVYAAEARKAFKENLEQSSIENIQTCILIGNSCKGEGDSEAESLYFVLANRMAQILRIWIPNEADDGVARETKIRLWWTCFILDTWASGGSGLSRQTRPTFKKVRVPMDEYVFYNMKSGDPDITDSNWRPGLWGHMVNLVELYVQIQDLHHTLADTVEWDEDFIEDTVRRLDAQLTRFGTNLEPHFQWSLDNLETYIRKGLGGAFVAFHLGYYHYGTLLFYQYLDHRRPVTRHGRAYADRCKWNAKMVCDILKASRQRKGAEALYNIVGHVTVVSSSVLLHTYLFGEAHELPESRERLESNLESLVQLRNYWPSVELMINRLVVFQSNCMRTMTRNTYRFDRWMVKFLIQHASALEDKEEDLSLEEAQIVTAAEGSQLERSQVTQIMMRDIQCLEFTG